MTQNRWKAMEQTKRYYIKADSWWHNVKTKAADNFMFILYLQYVFLKDVFGTVDNFSYLMLQSKPDLPVWAIRINVWTKPQNHTRSSLYFARPDSCENFITLGLGELTDFKWDKWFRKFWSKSWHQMTRFINGTSTQFSARTKVQDRSD